MSSKPVGWCWCAHGTNNLGTKAWHPELSIVWSPEPKMWKGLILTYDLTLTQIVTLKNKFTSLLIFFPLRPFDRRHMHPHRTVSSEVSQGATLLVHGRWLDTPVNAGLSDLIPIWKVHFEIVFYSALSVFTYLTLGVTVPNKIRFLKKTNSLNQDCKRLRAKFEQKLDC